MGVVYLLQSMNQSDLYQIGTHQTFNLQEIYSKYDFNIMLLHVYQIKNSFLFKHLYNHIKNLRKYFEYDKGFFKGNYMGISNCFMESISQVIPANTNNIDNFDQSLIDNHYLEEIKYYIPDYSNDSYFDGDKKYVHILINNYNEDNFFIKFRMLVNNLATFAINTKSSVDKYGKLYWKNIFDKKVIENNNAYDINDPSLLKQLKKHKKKHNNCVINSDLESELKESLENYNIFDKFHEVIASDCIINGSYYVVVNERSGKDFIITFSIAGKLKQYLMQKNDNIFIIEKEIEKDDEKSQHDETEDEHEHEHEDKNTDIKVLDESESSSVIYEDDNE